MDTDQIIRLLRNRRIFIENNRFVLPKYGIVFAVLRPGTNEIVQVGRCSFPLTFPIDGRPEGLQVVYKSTVIEDTKNRIRYVTICSSQYNEWEIGQLIHTDGELHISTNPNHTEEDNLTNLALGYIFEDAIE